MVLKKSRKLLVASALCIGFIGCGGGGGGVTSSSTGTGYYVDSAVAGVSYTCGSQTGITDEDGKFTFEKGKECTFEVAGVTLKKVPADNLADNVKIIESNLTVARFVQSLDNDGNPNNGIKITDETKTALKKAFQEENITTISDATTKLAVVVDHVKQEDSNFNGRVVTEEEAQTHLTQTQTDITKELLAGKTFYVVGQSLTDSSDVWYGEAAFNKSLTSMTWTDFIDTQDNGKESIQVEGDKLLFLSDTDGSYTIIGLNRGDYIEVTDYFADGSIESHTRLYYDKAKAQAYFDSLNVSSDTKFTKDMLAGKTFYVATQKTLQKLEFIFDNDSVSIVGDEDFNEPVSYEIDSNGELVFSDIKFSFVSKNDDYIEASYTNTPSSFTDDTEWFESTYDVNVSSFNNSAIKLKDWFLQNGLWDTTITADGKINKFGDIAYDGYWYIKNNIFYFAYPDGDGRDHLDIKAYKVENDRLLKQTDAPYTETVRLYYNEEKRDAWLNSLKNAFSNVSDLKTLIVGKTLYQHCADENGEWIATITVQEDGNLSIVDNGISETIPYRIDGNIIYTTEDGTEKTHTLIESTDTYIKFDDGNGEASTFYFTAEAAQAAPADDCGDYSDQIPANGIATGNVVFKDGSGNPVSTPSDAWIRITPEENQIEGNWNGLRCKIASDGSFGTSECYIYGDYDEMQSLFNTSSSFQVVVFKNHKNPDEYHWDCGEDVYKYVGDGNNTLWQNIEVLPEDYQDRSGESCN